MNSTTSAPASARAAIHLGALLTKKDGSPVRGAAMTFSPPYWVFEGGVAVRNYGANEQAALADYDRLVAQQWRGQVQQVAA